MSRNTGRYLWKSIEIAYFIFFWRGCYIHISIPFLSQENIVLKQDVHCHYRPVSLFEMAIINFSW